MNRLVLHIGPGKCGSSTIQRALAARAALPGGFAYTLLDPSLLARLGAASPAEDDLAEFAALAAAALRSNTTAVFSHEFIFNRPASLAPIVRLAQDHSDDIRIVGYSRRPSGFLQSSFCQWIFRSPERTREIWAHVRDAGFEPKLFSGLERHFIAAVVTRLESARQLSGDSIIDWKKTYDEIEKTAASFGARLSVGTLPAENTRVSLVRDFFIRGGLEVFYAPDLENLRANSQFHMDVVEACQLALMHGVKMPSPHEHNDFFDASTAMLPPAEPRSAVMLEALKAYVDGMLWVSNKALAEKFGFDPTGLRPSRHIGIDDALSAVEREQDQRRRNPGLLLAERTRLAAQLANLSYGHYYLRAGKTPQS